MINKLKKLCTDQSIRYPTTYEEDLEILEKKDLTENQRNSVLCRSGEKLILHKLVRIANICLDYSLIGNKVSINRKQKKILINSRLKMDYPSIFAKCLFLC